MKSILIAIIFFIIGLIVWWWLWFKMSLNFSYDKMTDLIKNDLPTSIWSWTQKINLIYGKEKERIMKEISDKKQEILNNIKQQAKDYISKQIDNMFK